MRQVVLMPILQKYGFEISAIDLNFVLMALATVLMAAGGYVLNDYFDVKIDAINHPDRLIITNTVSKQKAMLYYQLLTGVGVLLGLLLAFRVNSFTLAFVFIVVPGLLWFYSSSYKRQFLIGNIIVALLAALSVLIVAIVELSVLEQRFGKLLFETPIPGQFYTWIGGFSVFSFLLTLLREIIKDIEDEKGDREMECRTIVLKWGLPRTKLLLYLLICIIVVALYAVEFLMMEFEGSLTIKYITYGLALPLAVLAFLIYKAQNTTDFNQASTFVKFIMLSGVLYSFIFYFQMAKMYSISVFDLFIIK
jgi:4-hydroxybenzoate polyprenyltransferase